MMWYVEESTHYCSTCHQARVGMECLCVREAFLEQVAFELSLEKKMSQVKKSGAGHDQCWANAAYRCSKQMELYYIAIVI